MTTSLSMFFGATRFWVIVGFGVFFAASAVVSLPRLREVDKPNSDVSANALGQSLDGLKVSAAQLERYYTNELNGDPLDINTPASVSADAGAAPAPGRLTAQSSMPDASAPNARGLGSALGVRQQTLRDADEFTLDFHARWNDLVNGSEHLRDAVVDYQDQAAKNAVSGFHLSNIDHQGSREEREQFLAIQMWFTTAVTTGKEQVRTCTGALGLSRPDFQSWALLTRFARRAANSDDVDSAQVETLHHELIDRTTWLLNKVPSLRSACFIPKWPDSPRPVPLGQSLGPMRWLAAWLLNADSLPLALIVGMMGFGLLGSVISTFVSLPEEERKRDGGVAMDRLDFSRMVLRGLSAAVIVFLAAQGGLAVLSSSDSAPNPYVVLLACFVSAVFSESVWQSAYQYLQKRLQSGIDVQREGPGKGPPAGIGAAEGAAAESPETPGR